MKKIAISLLLLTGLFLASCGDEGPQAPDAGKLTTYTDDATNFSIDYPENWDENKVVGKQFQAFSIKEGKIRFSQFDTKGQPVARVSMTIMVLDSGQGLETALDTNYVFAKEYYTAPVDAKVGGMTGKKVTYSFPLSDGQFDGELIVATKDDQLYHIIKFEAFAGTMEKYRKTFDEMLNSVKLGTKPEKTVVTGEAEELPPPSSKMKTVKGNGYSIRIPDNFETSNKGGRTIYAGERRGDSYVSVTSAATNSKNLEGTANKNAKAVGASKITKLKLGGKEAYLISYSATSAIQRDMYYVINDGKLYQIVVDYFKEEADMYKNILTKSAQSIKF